MNERIKELAIQAGMIVGDAGEFDMTKFMPKEVKFAELIVQECKDLLFESSENNRLPIAVDDMIHIIDTHFGVEE